MCATGAHLVDEQEELLEGCGADLRLQRRFLPRIGVCCPATQPLCACKRQAVSGVPVVFVS